MRDSGFSDTIEVLLNVKEKCVMSRYDGKKIIIIGDRDGIPAPAIAECLKDIDCEVVFASTECFV